MLQYNPFYSYLNETKDDYNFLLGTPNVPPQTYSCS